jgi:hypothetical protein
MSDAGCGTGSLRLRRTIPKYSKRSCLLFVNVLTGRFASLCTPVALLPGTRSLPWCEDIKVSYCTGLGRNNRLGDQLKANFGLCLEFVILGVKANPYNFQPTHEQMLAERLFRSIIRKIRSAVRSFIRSKGDHEIAIRKGLLRGLTVSITFD